ncbi:unnamed protein product [Miscanthus lutarioriparius]|uniref:Uncharacterized protein n=1 Tax=Miscanthus lutarioriparius TaxID=422564 RepID=A0A811PZ65_9POAL|nr:unnamed protein product [Miscanthus lutarioriparius]
MADGGGGELEASGGSAPVFDGRGGSGELGASGGSVPALPRPWDLMTTAAAEAAPLRPRAPRRGRRPQPPRSRQRRSSTAMRVPSARYSSSRPMSPLRRIPPVPLSPPPGREPFVDPVVTKCKHYFCEHCGLKRLYQDARNKLRGQKIGLFLAILPEKNDSFYEAGD